MTAWALLWLSFRHNDPADSPPLVTPLDKCFVDKSNGQVTRVVVTALWVVRGPWSSPCRPSHPHPHSHPHQSPSPGRKGIENVDNWIHTWMITILKPLLAPIGQLCSLLTGPLVQQNLVRNFEIRSWSCGDVWLAWWINGFGFSGRTAMAAMAAMHCNGLAWLVCRRPRLNRWLFGKGQRKMPKPKPSRKPRPKAK